MKHCIVPIAFGWSYKYGNWKVFGRTHAWCIGYKRAGPEWPDSFEPIYGWTLHLGPLKVYFGKLKAVPNG